jgi:hypothetical protein
LGELPQAIPETKFDQVMTDRFNALYDGLIGKLDLEKIRNAVSNNDRDQLRRSLVMAEINAIFEFMEDLARLSRNAMVNCQAFEVRSTQQNDIDTLHEYMSAIAKVITEYNRQNCTNRGGWFGLKKTICEKLDKWKEDAKKINNFEMDPFYERYNKNLKPSVDWYESEHWDMFRLYKVYSGTITPDMIMEYDNEACLPEGPSIELEALLKSLSASGESVAEGMVAFGELVEALGATAVAGNDPALTAEALKQLEELLGVNATAKADAAMKIVMLMQNDPDDAAFIAQNLDVTSQADTMAIFEYGSDAGGSNNAILVHLTNLLEQVDDPNQRRIINVAIRLLRVLPKSLEDALSELLMKRSGNVAADVLYSNAVQAQLDGVDCHEPHEEPRQQHRPKRGGNNSTTIDQECSVTITGQNSGNITVNCNKNQGGSTGKNPEYVPPWCAPVAGGTTGTPTPAPKTNDPSNTPTTPPAKMGSNLLSLLNELGGAQGASGGVDQLVKLLEAQTALIKLANEAGETEAAKVLIGEVANLLSGSSADQTQSIVAAVDMMYDLPPEETAALTYAMKLPEDTATVERIAAISTSGPEAQAFETMNGVNARLLKEAVNQYRANPTPQGLEAVKNYKEFVTNGTMNKLMLTMFRPYRNAEGSFSAEEIVQKMKENYNTANPNGKDYMEYYNAFIDAQNNPTQ